MNAELGGFESAVKVGSAKSVLVTAMAHNGVPGHDHSQCNPENGECFSLYSYVISPHLEVQQKNRARNMFCVSASYFPPCWASFSLPWSVSTI